MSEMFLGRCQLHNLHHVDKIENNHWYLILVTVDVNGCILHAIHRVPICT